MTSPTPVAAVEHALAHELMLEVDTSATATPEWSKVRFSSAIDPVITPSNSDATTYDDEGTDHQERTGETWTLSFNVNRYRTSTGAFLPEHEVLRKAGDPGKRGEDAQVRVRWYDKKGADEAYEGTANVQWKRANTGAKDLGTATVTLTGVGVLEPIDNPAAGA